MQSIISNIDNASIRPTRRVLLVCMSYFLCARQARLFLRPAEMFTLWPCSHSQFYPTREPFTNGTRRVARVHTASTAPGSSGTLRPHQEVFAVDANGTGRRCSLKARVDASDGRVRQRRAVCACLQTDLFLSTPLIGNAANRVCRNHGTN